MSAAAGNVDADAIASIAVPVVAWLAGHGAAQAASDIHHASMNEQPASWLVRHAHEDVMRWQGAIGVQTDARHRRRDWFTFIAREQRFCGGLLFAHGFSTFAAQSVLV